MSALSPLLLALLAAALFLFAGLGVLQLFPALRERPVAARMGWAWLLGVSSVGTLLWAASHLLGLSLGRRLIWPLFAALALLRFAARRSPAPEREFRPRRSLSTRLAVGTAAVLCGLVAAGLLANSVTDSAGDHDGPMTWDAAARWIRAGQSVNPVVLREPLWYVTHPQYPLLLPLMQKAPQTALGTTDDMRVVRPLYTLFFAALLLVLYDVASRHAGRLAAALATLALALVPFISSNLKYGGAGTTYSDLPLAALWGGGFLLLLEPGLVPRDGIAAGLLLAGAVLTKNEGAPLALIALASGAAAALAEARRRRRPMNRFLLPLAAAGAVTAAAFALLVSWSSRIPNRNDEDYPARLRDLPVLESALARLPLLPEPVWETMTDETAWADFWFAAPVLLAGGAGALRRRKVRPLLLAPAAALGVFVIAYGITPWPGTDLVRATFSRFLVQVSIPLFVVTAMALADAIRKTRGLRDNMIRRMSRMSLLSAVRGAGRRAKKP